ncbi:YbhN family protein [Halovivax sp.]|uniref:lysylphosphatidylglycerol synthase transmembrane domain-containing protein n=1 Tax=Halovivax sp. TaxID=1935978 RepID=UPI0025C4BA81|nr:lysylphosphatidylglycerol synthase transmembrane domain-containing protein [Halovivax sp.]
MKRRIALGFLIAAVLLALLVTLVGREQVFEDLSGANPTVVALGLGSGALMLVFRGLVWVQFLRTIDASITRRHVYGIFFSAMFVKYVTPYGQVATEPFVAYIASRDAEMAYEDGLAGVLSADVLNYVPYYSFGFLAIGWTIANGAVGADIQSYLIAFSGVFLALITLSFVVVKRPGVIYRIVLGTVSVVQRPVSRVAGGFAAKLSPAAVRERLDGFYRSVDVIAADRKLLVVSTLYAHVGMVFLMLPIYLGGQALGYDIAVSVVVLAAALGKLGAFVPAPGGLGGVEGFVTGALVILGSLSPSAAFSIALIYRVCTYWLTIFVGGMGAFALVLRR